MKCARLHRTHETTFFSDSNCIVRRGKIFGLTRVGNPSEADRAQAGVRVLLCEKGRVAGEQSSRNWGWVRQQGRDWAELPIMIESNRIWLGRRANKYEVGKLLQDIHALTHLPALARVGTPDGDFPDHQDPV